MTLRHISAVKIYGLQNFYGTVGWT